MTRIGLETRFGTHPDKFTINWVSTRSRGILVRNWELGALGPGDGGGKKVSLWELKKCKNGSGEINNKLVS